tara:strand:- start:431 stop:928 length:498 start_codon:yes stop_codon:yes gene_type:complete
MEETNINDIPIEDNTDTDPIVDEILEELNPNEEVEEVEEIDTMDDNITGYSENVNYDNMNNLEQMYEEEDEEEEEEEENKDGMVGGFLSSIDKMFNLKNTNLMDEFKLPLIVLIVVLISHSDFVGNLLENITFITENSFGITKNIVQVFISSILFYIVLKLTNNM